VEVAPVVSSGIAARRRSIGPGIPGRQKRLPKKSWREIDSNSKVKAVRMNANVLGSYRRRVGYGMGIKHKEINMSIAYVHVYDMHYKGNNRRPGPTRHATMTFGESAHVQP